jgi:putative transposase
MSALASRSRVEPPAWRDFQAQLVEMNGQAEHVHVLINYPLEHSVSSLVNRLNAKSRK